MTVGRGILIVGLALYAIVGGAGSIRAQDGFDARLADAQRLYRAALYATRDAGKPDALDAVTAYATALQRVIADFQTPPPHYERDTQWVETLEEIASLSDGAVRAIRADDVVMTHDHLELIRKLIRDLRRRNGVLVYSDIVSTYHIEIEAIRMGGYTPAALDKPDAFGRLREQVGVLEHIASRLERDALFVLVADPDFRPAVDGLYASIDALRRAVVSRDKKATLDAMDGLLPAYWAFFLKFG